MEYKKGHTIKPKETLTNGVVIFTDGTNDVSPNQISCEAYGYKWNRKNNTCQGFRSNFKIEKLFKNATNTNIGSGNITERATENTFINGNKNRTKGNNRNILISGESHQVESGINNASIFGAYGNAIRQGEQVLGGGGVGSDSPKLGYAQHSKVVSAGQSDGTAPTSIYLQSGSKGITLVDNSLVCFKVQAVGMRYAGSYGTGANGDFVWTKIEGYALMKDTPVLNFTETVVKGYGTYAVFQGVTPSINNSVLYYTVNASQDVDVNWVITTYLYETRTDIDI